MDAAGSLLGLLVWSCAVVCVHGSNWTCTPPPGSSCFSSNISFLANPGPRQLLDKSDAARTIAFTIVQGKKACQEFPGFLWYFANSTAETPLGGLDVYALDDEGLRCVQNLTEAHPGYVRRVVSLVSPESQVRAKFRPARASGDSAASASGARPRRLWPSNVYQYIIWVIFEELMAQGMHVIHFDTDVIILRDLWTNLVSPVRSGYDIITTCDKFGPGSDRGCSFNPAVMFMRHGEAVQSMLSWIMQLWDTSWLDPQTHQMPMKIVRRSIGSTHDLSDMFVMNRYRKLCLISANLAVTQGNEQFLKITSFRR
ncbi:unnamed protein product [Prorocentrum cordatum]|uniref:Nucleotide-diphospho-sugar transferase domain-containing protein n=1 Tax=Prorocentrum cordatum TaxID=2364126 RepID=A0ABN9T9R8_9DINO|nr:unnamed protein product [Polarella glacialis]